MENEAIPVRSISFKAKKEVSVGVCKKFLKAKTLCGNFGAKIICHEKKIMMLQGHILNYTKMLEKTLHRRGTRTKTCSNAYTGKKCC